MSVGFLIPSYAVFGQPIHIQYDKLNLPQNSNDLWLIDVEKHIPVISNIVSPLGNVNVVPEKSIIFL